MIKKLRKKFIAIAMISVIVVLTLIMGTVNIANYISINERSERTLEILEENNGEFPFDEFHRKEKRVEDKSLSAETPFETRYFTVTMLKDGTVSTINTGRIFAVSSNTAKEYAETLFNSNKTKGFIEHYKYILINNDSGYMYIFVDCERELSTFRSFLFASIGISFVGILLVFILVVIFSRIAVRPVAESYEKQKRFITDASHEIKTPLAIIDANTEVIEMINGENEWSESIRNQIKRLNALTEKMVFLSRMDEESYVMVMEEFSFSEAVSDTVEPFVTLANSKNKTLTTDIEENLTIKANEQSIRQLVSILLDNAVKYTNEGGNIEVRLFAKGKTKILTVYNTVEEIQKGKLDFLFERFYRLDSSRNSETGGSGIGLSVAKAIAQSNNGRLTAYSTDGKSICFTFTV
ncbi:MAG: HAMP domain-containing histidine kinase [Clostridia bacterium]|nr:HAMP domain-containing histidine kinase [Clostridia bacterium]